MNPMTRGEIARRCAVNVATMRYYEERGLLPRPPRSGSNYRLYQEDSVRRVRFIKRAQDLGFTLGEIQDLLEFRTGPGDCAAVLEKVERKIAAIDEKIGALRAMRKALERLGSECSGKGSAAACPILEFLDDEEIAGGALVNLERNEQGTGGAGRDTRKSRIENRRSPGPGR